MNKILIEDHETPYFHQEWRRDWPNETTATIRNENGANSSEVTRKMMGCTLNFHLSMKFFLLQEVSND